MAMDALAAGLPPSRNPRDLHRLGEKVDEQLDALTLAVSEIQAGMRVLAVGIDYARYDRFQRLVPSAFEYDGELQVLSQPFYNPTSEEYDYCVEFVITAALRIAEVNAHRTAPSWEPL
jgi:hypothetical protein